MSDSSSSEIPNSSDAISRQAAIDIVVSECGKWTGLAKEISKQIKQLPFVQPERETGRWIDKKCSRCGCGSMLGLCIENFCPNCGARMTEEDV